MPEGRAPRNIYTQTNTHTLHRKDTQTTQWENGLHNLSVRNNTFWVTRCCEPIWYWFCQPRHAHSMNNLPKGHTSATVNRVYDNKYNLMYKYDDTISDVFAASSMPLQMISCTQCEQLAQGLYLCNGQQANGLQNRHKWLDEWCLGSRLHAFTDDLVHAVDGRFAQQWTRGH